MWRGTGAKRLFHATYQIFGAAKPCERPAEWAKPLSIRHALSKQHIASFWANLRLWVWKKRTTVKEGKLHMLQAIYIFFCAGSNTKLPCNGQQTSGWCGLAMKPSITRSCCC